MDKVYFKINGVKYAVGGELSVDTTLNEFIRRHANLPGTKFMCMEGGCGACIVHVRAAQPGSLEYVEHAVNSCLIAVMSCDGWDITTIEGIGNRKIGYNIIQKRLNHFFGSQCGYCSPGFVMNMYSLIHSSNHLTDEEIEKSFGSNLCRCTGYRPILEAFKSLSGDADKKILAKIKDIEDISQEICPKSNQKCSGTCKVQATQSDWCFIDVKNIKDDNVLPKKITLVDGRLWFAVKTIRSIFSILDDVGYESYMLVAGNTAKGVRPLKEYPKVLIDISTISELTTHYFDVNLVLGANMTLTHTMKLFRQLSRSNRDFWYLDVMYKHMEQVAHIPVRNIGTLAGNLVLKHGYRDFQSDIFLLFECLGATITLVDRKLIQTELNLIDFLETDLVGKIIKEIKLPPLSRRNELVTYKIMPREQNAHAEVNSAFLFKFNPQSHYVETASIVYGGINPSFSHAYETEKFLVGKFIFKNDVLQAALRCLDSEIHPNRNPPEPKPSFRKKLALGLFYKCIIKLCPRDLLSPIYESGATTASDDRPSVSRSYQEYDTDKSDYPITQPLLKKEGMIQCAGEAMYTNDLPTVHDEVFAALVLSTIAKGEIESIDGSGAMKLEGIYAILTSKDIPGTNSIVRGDFRLYYENEELLASHKISFYNQPLAIVVAKTQVLADIATRYVKIKYKNTSKKPIIFTIEDALKAPKEENRLVPYNGITPSERGSNTTRVIKGNFISPRQYHFMMELHTSLAKPVDDGLEIHSSLQFLDLTQATIAKMMNMPESLITLKTTRCGGGFGCKLSRANFAVCCTALVAKLMNKTCRMSMNMRDIMRVTGKRPNTRLDYEIEVDEKGEIQYMDAVFYVNDGFSRNENENLYTIESFKNCYNSNRWKVDSFGVITDAPSNTFMRAPGGFEGISAIEHIMEHIAEELGIDPVVARTSNYRREDNDLPALVPMFMERIDFGKRKAKISEFNSSNRWKKRGMRLANMAFPSAYIGNYGALVSVYHGDGSVSVSIGGVEIGQGIFTKISQVAAREFGIPVTKVTVMPSMNFSTPNNFGTASSITTECCAYSVIRCCDQINARLAPIRATMPTASFEEVVYQADLRGILLQANYHTNELDPRLVNYSIFGVAVTEVEIDILTGRKWIVRADILEDVGRSMNPALDVGQIEGAFTQALSLWTIEKTIYNEDIGEIYTDRTWNYKIMGAKDIPNDLRVYLRRNTINPVGILGSKAVGEPPICMGHVIVDALREAIQASRRDSGYKTPKFLNIDVPVTNEVVVEEADVKVDEYLLH